MASLWPEPWRAMCSSASSSESTTRTAIDEAEELGGVVGLGGLGQPGAGVAEQVEAGAVHAQLDALRRAGARPPGAGTTGAASRCTRSVSAALQTPGRCTLALTAIFSAMSRSAPAST